MDRRDFIKNGSILLVSSPLILAAKGDINDREIVSCGHCKNIRNCRLSWKDRHGFYEGFKIHIGPKVGREIDGMPIAQCPQVYIRGIHFPMKIKGEQPRKWLDDMGNYLNQYIAKRCDEYNPYV